MHRQPASTAGSGRGAARPRGRAGRHRRTPKWRACSAAPARRSCRLPGEGGPRSAAAAAAAQARRGCWPGHREQVRCPCARPRDAAPPRARRTAGPEIDRCSPSAGGAGAAAGAARQRCCASAWPPTRRRRAGCCASRRGAVFWQAARAGAAAARVGIADGAVRLACTRSRSSAWGLIGRAALAGGSTGWLVAWAAARAVDGAAAARRRCGYGRLFALDAGRLLKRRLLAGALRSRPDAMRQQGVGHLLGRVIEVAGARVAGAQRRPRGRGRRGSSCVSASGHRRRAARRRWPHLVLLAAWLACAPALAWRYVAPPAALDASRAGADAHLVEQMVGHRTRLAQERPAPARREEDAALDGYLARPRRRWTRRGRAPRALPRGWMLLALAGLAPAVRRRRGPAGAWPSAWAACCSRSARSAASRGGLAGLARGGIAWRQVAPIFHAGGQRQCGRKAAQPFAAGCRGAAAAPLADRGASGLGFALSAAARRSLAGCGLRHRARRPDPARRRLGRRQVDARRAARPGCAARSPGCCCSAGSTARRSARRLARAGHRGAAVPREPHPLRHARPSTC